MPITNLNNKHFAAEKVTEISNSLNQLEALLADKLENLTATDRQRYGSINEQNKLFVNKVMDYRRNQPTLCSPDVDWTEFDQDFACRGTIEKITSQLDKLFYGLQNAKILHDYDNYQAALVDYDYTTYKAGTATAGFEVKRNELKQFFSKSTTATTAAATPSNP